MNKKRFLSMLIAAAMMASSVQLAAVAEEPTEDNFAEIGTVSETSDEVTVDSDEVTPVFGFAEEAENIALLGTTQILGDGRVHYEADFTKTYPDNWILGPKPENESAERKYYYSVDTSVQTLKNSWNDKYTMNAIAVCDEYIWSNNYTFSVDLYNNGNSNSNTINLIFNYSSDSDYYFIEFGGADNAPTNVEFKKMVNGNDETIATCPTFFSVKNQNTPPTVKITYNNGSISVVGIAGGQETVLFDGVRDATFTKGKIGFGAKNSVGFYKNVIVEGEGESTILNQISQNIENGAQNVSLLPEFRIGFDMNLDRGTVTKENIKVSKLVPERQGGQTVIVEKPINDEYYNIGLDIDDHKIIVVNVLHNLDTYQDYRLSINGKVLSAMYQKGIMEDFVLDFKTKKPDFGIESSQFINEQYNKDITNAIASWKTRGPVNADIKVANRNIDGTQPYVLTVMLKNSDDGTNLWHKSFSGSIAKGETEDLTTRFELPSDVATGAAFNFYLWDGFKTMKTLEYSYPAVTFANSDFVNITSNTAEGTITVSGTLPNKLQDRIITMLVTNPSFTADTATEEGAIQNQAEIVTGAGGEFSYTFKIKNGASGKYNFYFGGDDFTSVKNIPYFYAFAEDVKTALEDINNTDDAASMAAKLGQYKEVLGFDEDYFNTINTDKLAQKVLSRVKESAFPTDDASEASDFIKREALLEAYRQSKSNAVADSNGTILYQNILGLDTLDKDKNLTVVNFYNTKLKDAGKKAVLSALLGKTYPTVEDFQNEFIKQVVVAGIDNCNIDGYGHIKELLTKNGAAAGLDLSKYNSNLADQPLFKAGVKSLEDLQNKINNLSTAIPTPQVITGGSGGGGSTSGSSKTKNVNSMSGINAPSTAGVVTPVPEKVINLTDMDNHKWAETAVKRLMKDRIIIEPLDGRFRPMDNITRAEFTKMMVLALGTKIEIVDSEFEDLTADDWATPYVMAAKKAGLITGMDETHFGPNEEIRRQDAMVILNRAFKFAYTGEDESAWDFDDIDQISDYAVEPMKTMVLLGKIHGVGNRLLSPLSSCTRAESAQLIYNTVYGGGDDN